MSKQTDLINIPDAITVSGSNVGIGVSPSTNLHVKSSNGGLIQTIEASDSGNAYTKYINSTTGSGDFTDGLLVGIDTDESATFWQFENTHMKFGTNGTERMRIDATGAVTMPSQPAFLVRPVGSQVNIPNLTTTTVLFGAEVFDQNSDFSSNTFTAPVTGKYQLSYGLRLEQVNSASSYYHFHLRTSNRVYANLIDPRCFDQNPDYWDIGLSALADMDAGDTAYITAFQAFGSVTLDIHGDSFFSGYLVA